MGDRPLVVLVGNSLLMDGVAVSLAERRILGLEQIYTECEDMQERLKSLEPDLILFELDHPKAQSISSLLRAQPDLLLIGLDLESCQAIVLNSHHHLARSMEEFCKLLQDEVAPVPRT